MTAKAKPRPDKALPVHVLLAWANDWNCWCVIAMSRDARRIDGLRRRLTVYCNLECAVTRAASMADEDVVKSSEGVPLPKGKRSYAELLKLGADAYPSPH